MNTQHYPDFTLCTYTYNDGTLARELLKHAAAWPERPSEVIVVDDGSEPAFTLAPEITEAFGPNVELRIIRLPENVGPGVCKAAGLAAARGEYILSLDCDMRLPRAWLTAAFEMVAQPGVGLVGGAVVSDAGEDAVSRYLRQVDHHLRPDGETDFVSGATWLLPRAVWEATGGFGDYTSRTHEDHHFCGRVRNSGYKVMSCTASQIRQVRVLSRADMLRRFRAWLEPSMREQCAGYDTVQAPAFQICKESLRRLEYLLRSSEGDVAFVYLEVLLCLYTLQYMCGFKDNEASQGAERGLHLAVGDLLAARPQTRDLLALDLGLTQGFGSPEGQGGPADEQAGPVAGPGAGQGAAPDGSADASAAGQLAQWRQFWRMMFEPLRGLFGSPLGEKLENEGIPALLEADKSVKTDYSFYKDL